MAADPSKLSYLSLPAEIRNNIMSLVLVHGDIYPHTPISKASTRSPDATVVSQTRPGIQLIATCTQAYQEGHALFYSSNTFHLPLAMAFEWSDRLQAKHKAMIKRISITIRSNEMTAAIISHIERSMPTGVLEMDGHRLGEAVAETLDSGWKSKVRHLAAWTTLEEIVLYSFNRTYTLQHDDIVAHSGDIDKWDRSTHGHDLLTWPVFSCFSSIMAQVDKVGWNETIEWLRTREQGELVEGFWSGVDTVVQEWLGANNPWGVVSF